MNLDWHREVYFFNLERDPNPRRFCSIAPMYGLQPVVFDDPLANGRFPGSGASRKKR